MTYQSLTRFFLTVFFASLGVTASAQHQHEGDVEFGTDVGWWLIARRRLGLRE